MTKVCPSSPIPETCMPAVALISVMFTVFRALNLIAAPPFPPAPQNSPRALCFPACLPQYLGCLPFTQAILPFARDRPKLSSRYSPNPSIARLTAESSGGLSPLPRQPTLRTVRAMLNAPALLTVLSFLLTTLFDPIFCGVLDARFLTPLGLSLRLAVHPM